MMSAIEKFAARIVKVDRWLYRGGPCFDPCWMWIGGTRASYGSFWVDGKHQMAHRWSYEHFIGPIPDGAELDHLCRQPLCANPWHTEAVAHRINVQRGKHGERRFAPCPAGHPFTPENFRIDTRKSNGNQYRVCRRCELDRWHSKHVRILRPVSQSVQRGS